MMQSIIDIGSNTIRLAIYRIEAGRVELLLKKKQTVGLAAYIKDGVMQPEGIARAAAALQDFTAFLQEIGLPLTAAFATAALRNAVNREEALAAIKARTGLAIRVLSGTEEAELGFIGATHDLAAPAVLMADIGGGSTELVRCDNRAVVAKLSLPIGSLQLAARHVRGLFPTPKESIRIAKDAENALAALDAPLSATAEEPAGSPFSGPFPTLCGIGGTFKGARNLYRSQPFPGNALTLSRCRPERNDHPVLLGKSAHRRRPRPLPKNRAGSPPHPHPRPHPRPRLGEAAGGERHPLQRCRRPGRLYLP